jgi:hypothetical protein
MKKILSILLILISYNSFAQNYDCLQPGVKHFFTNSNGYLRGIRIDSVKTYADSTIYFPYHTPRGRFYFTTGVTDTSMGSWLGKRVMRQNDGTFLFDNIWNDTVIIKTQAHTGDSWVMYNDTTKHYCQAAVIAEDTMTILGVVDSVKKILITARDPLGIVATDPLDSLELILSKNNGFVSVIDLYTFPYHAPDSAFAHNNDYFLDRVSDGSKVHAKYNIFNLINFSWPTQTQLYNWNVGDVYQKRFCRSRYSEYENCRYPGSVIFDSVTSKTVFPDHVAYTTAGWRVYQKFNFRNDPYNYYEYASELTSRSFSVPNAVLFDTSLLPEEHRQKNIFYYHPSDTSFCMQSEQYETYPSDIDATGHTPTFSEGMGGPYIKYKKEIDVVLDYSIGTAELTDLILSNLLVYYTHNGITCGSYISHTALAIDQVNKSMEAISVFPNPATDKITIIAADKIRSVTISNLLGQNMSNTEHNSSKVQVSVSGLPAGIYFMKINGTDSKRFIKE